MNIMIFSKDINSKNIILVSGGDASIPKLEQSLNYKLVIAADSGVDNCLKLGLIPDLVIGDLDSISNDSLNFIKSHKIKIFKYPVDKDMTDTELVLFYIQNNCPTDTTLYIFGFNGSRLDHSLINILLLDRYSKFFKIKLINDNNIIQLIEKKMIFPKDNYYYSLVPISNDGIVVSLIGFKFPLNSKKIEFSSSLAISNKIIDKEAVIYLHSGCGILIRSFE
ncbi:thiamine diphosphokinase [Citroniella saccharovorans]|uniref:Thiamine diphosphokinase n=1 Tax=Citroniella saccharovorans TaxID=2053367 RepID=A0AAW9MR17_9FIRM|nr:thiamine diphosphokinase [Citroniella saccharovorans]MEB3429516.1 thiamine diphosphokinase [Citroniella saccharovorans]